MLREITKVIVAGTDLDPSICHAYEGLLEVIIAKTGSAQHGASWRAMRSIGQSMTARLGQRVTHCRVPSMVINCGHLGIKNPGKTKAIIPSQMMARKRPAMLS